MNALLLSLNLLFMAFAVTKADDCGVRTLSKVIELYREFDALYIRGCQDLKINIDTYLVIRKKCFKNLIRNFDYDIFGELLTEFYSSACFKETAIESCSALEYKKFKHCAFDFGLEHMEEGLELYRNETIRLKAYHFAIESKNCLTKSLNEIEANQQIKTIQS